MFKYGFTVTTAICFSMFLLLSACNKDADKKTSTQVAAKVNSSEISLHQINQVMKSAKDVTPQNAPIMRQQILDKLVDQQIVVEKAMKENLDRTPDVMMAIEAAKKDILARAYLQKMVANSVKISDQDIKQYYDQHPELFSKRRIYNLQDIGTEKNEQVAAQLKAELDKQKSMQEIADSLKSQGIKFSAGAYNRPAEQIPLEILPQLQALDNGQTTVINLANATHVIKLVNAQDAPINLIAATPFIKNYFINTRGKQLVEEEMKKYRAQAKIEYMGDFAEAKSDKTNKERPTQLTTGVEPADKSTLKKSSMEAGIAGLK